MRSVVGIVMGLALAVCAGLATARSAPDPAPASPRIDPKALEFFESRIRPLLARECLSCHGKTQSQGGLRLDTAEGFIRGGALGKVVTPGEPQKSLLIRAVSYTTELKMPPRGKLAAVQLAELAAWVKMGAPWPGAEAAAAQLKAPDPTSFSDEEKSFWAFRPVSQPAIPRVRNRAWVRNPVDAFILAGLEAKGLKPAPPADRRSLIRRLSFDLTGLPPTPEEVEAFVEDASADATARLVDRLLASPAYGERWGRHWLDVARYADSNGLDENTAFGNAWRYRDWVIRALNDDKPYDQFIRDQIAGDLLPSDDPAVRRDRLIATGFLSLGPKVLAEPDKQKMVMDIVDEQVDVVGRGFLGLTLGCARCHDHKFDPIRARDYYALAGIFKSTKTMATLATVARVLERPIGDEAAGARVAEHQKRLAERQDAERRAELAARAKVADAILKDAGRYLLHSSFAPGAAPPAGLDVVLARRVASRLAELRRMPRHPVLGPWLALSQQPESGFAAAAKQFWAAELAGLGLNSAAAAALGDQAPGTLAELAERYRGLFAAVEQAWQTQSAASNTPLRRLRETPLEQVRSLLHGPNSLFQLDTQDRLYPAEVRQQLATLKREVDELRRNSPEPAAMAIAVQDEAKIEDCRIHLRGNHLTLGDQVARGFIRIASTEQAAGTTLSSSSSGRRELAEWIASPSNPLTARVMVNRIWAHHFGEGIVRSPDNFGKLGERPTHPELLDWLAGRFVREGWSQKAMHRLVCLSNAYAMSTAHDARAALVDPENRLLWRMPRRRLEVEGIRDAILSVAGTLDRTMGGTLLPTANFGYVTNDQSGNGARYDTPRRSIYLPVIRNAVYDVFQVFDFVEPSTLNGKRSTTTVAPQALFLLNGDFVLKSAAAMAEHLLARDGDDEGRIREAVYRAFSRPATTLDVRHAQGFMKSFGDRLAAQVPEPERRHRLAWQAYCQLLFAANEFVTLN